MSKPTPESVIRQITEAVQAQEDVPDNINDDDVEEARIRSIEAFLNAMTEVEDNPRLLKEIAFRTLIVVAFGSLQSEEPEEFTNYALDCMLVAPNNIIKMAIREVTGTVFKAYLMTFTGEDVITPLMSSLIEESQATTKEEKEEIHRRYKETLGES